MDLQIYSLLNLLGGGVAPFPPAGYTSLPQALQTLCDDGFIVYPVIVWAYSATVPYYCVISQFPISGTSVIQQSTYIQLTVSAGPAPVPS